MINAEDIELVAEAGDVADLKELASRAARGREKDLALQLYRCLSNGRMDRSAVGAIARERKAVEAERADRSAKTWAAIAEDPSLQKALYGPASLEETVAALAKISKIR